MYNRAQIAFSRYTTTVTSNKVLTEDKLFDLTFLLCKVFLRL